ncbi:MULTISPECIES: hypothetical protein [unclassified Pseudomonas]|uniref:hypothetical protein n=1 Tax=unclassified Pseudomonas TaxID=196821 RepID=UPI002114F7EB|nr:MULTISPECIES: hypothetical protein [unclassified Pseudomonas]
MQVETPEVGADKAITPRYDTIVICGADDQTIPREVNGAEVVAWSLGHGLAAMDALEEFVDDLAAGNCKQPVHLTQGAADALNLMRRRRAIGWSADEPTAQAPADWRTAVARAESMARRVFGENNDDAMQAVDYMAGLLLACEPETIAPQLPITCEQIQEQMTGGGCPIAGSLGECAAIWCSGNSWTAALYIWNANFNDSTAVAEWFHNLGAVDVFVRHTLYDTNNGDRNGVVPEGGARQWLVEFSTKEVCHA